jgi:uncharacterized protein YjiS (DUF1127 family)
MRTTLSILSVGGAVFAPDRDSPDPLQPTKAATLQPASVRGFSLIVPPGRTLRLSRACGARLEVFRGRIWVTQSGQDKDSFLAAGDTCDVMANGVIVIEADGNVPAQLSWSHVPASLPPPRPPGSGRWYALKNALLAKFAARRTRLALRELDDRLMRDAGVPDAVREAVLASRSDRQPGDRERWLARCTW